MHMSPRRFVFVLALAPVLLGGCKESTGPDDDNGGVVDDGVLLAGSIGPASNLYRVPVQTSGVDQLVGPIRTASGQNLFITDLAVAPNGRLWGITFTELYRVDASTAVATLVGPLGVADMNAMTFAADGRLFAAGAVGNFARIDTVTGTSTRIGSYGSGLLSAGDLTFAPDGRLLATIIGFGNDLLATINPSTGAATLITAPPNSIGFAAVWGLDVVEGQLYGLTAIGTGGGPGVLIRVDPGTGAGTRVRDLTFAAGGATRPSNPSFR